MLDNAHNFRLPVTGSIIQGGVGIRGGFVENLSAESVAEPLLYCRVFNLIFYPGRTVLYIPAFLVAGPLLYCRVFNLIFYPESNALCIPAFLVAGPLTKFAGTHPKSPSAPDLVGDGPPVKDRTMRQRKRNYKKAIARAQIMS